MFGRNKKYEKEIAFLKFKIEDLEKLVEKRNDFMVEISTILGLYTDVEDSRYIVPDPELILAEVKKLKAPKII